MTVNEYDYSDYVSESNEVSEDSLTRLTLTVGHQAELEQQRADLELALERNKEELKRVQEQILPELMDELGLETFKTRNGLNVKVVEKTVASITKAKAAAAHQWLDDNGHGNLIKREFNIKFGKDEQAWARKFAADLKRRKRELTVTEKEAVNYQTLNAFVREALEEGIDLPEEISVIKIRKAEVKL